MRIPGTEMYLVTGLLVLFEIFLLGLQLASCLYFPQECKGLLYSWLLVLMILAYGSGFVVAGNVCDLFLGEGFLKLSMLNWNIFL